MKATIDTLEISSKSSQINLKPIIGVIDSKNISSEELEDLLSSYDYIIEPVKGIGIFKPKRWLETFGKSLTQNIIEAQILHTSMGLTLAIKRYAINPYKQTLEFAGLHSYTDESKFLKNLLYELWDDIQDCYITRIDVSMDFKGKVPNKVIKALCKDRKPFKWKNTTYYKSKKEKKSNNRLDIKIYNKAKKEKLDYSLMRLEFVFKSGYFNKTQVKDLPKILKKMEKTIKRFTGLKVTIKPL